MRAEVRTALKTAGRSLLFAVGGCAGIWLALEMKTYADASGAKVVAYLALPLLAAGMGAGLVGTAGVVASFLDLLMGHQDDRSPGSSDRDGIVLRRRRRRWLLVYGLFLPLAATLIASVAITYLAREGLTSPNLSLWKLILVAAGCMFAVVWGPAAVLYLMSALARRTSKRAASPPAKRSDEGPEA